VDLVGRSRALSKGAGPVSAPSRSPSQQSLLLEEDSHAAGLA
jgi:hypothetical protein